MLTITVCRDTECRGALKWTWKCFNQIQRDKAFLFFYFEFEFEKPNQPQGFDNKAFYCCKLNFGIVWYARSFFAGHRNFFQ